MRQVWGSIPEAGQIGHRVANDSPLLLPFFGAVLPRRHAAKMGPATLSTFRRNTASIIKIWFDLHYDYCKHLLLETHITWHLTRLGPETLKEKIKLFKRSK